MVLFRAVLLNVIVLAFFTTILDLLLPDSSFRSYIKMAMGFFTVLTILQPVVQLMQYDVPTFLQQTIEKAEQMAVAEVSASSEQINSEMLVVSYQEQVEAQYAEQIARQTKALLSLSDYTVQEVQCFFGDTTEEDAARQMWIKIQIVASTADDTAKVAQIQNAISGYYGLPVSQVEVRIVSEEESYNDDHAK